MNIKSREERAKILRCLIEGSSVRSTSRITGAAPNTVLKLLKDVGLACEAYQHINLRKLKCKRIQVDEVHSFVYAKQKNVPDGKENEAGTVWLWTSMCADTKLVPTWYLGTREANSAKKFIHDLASRLKYRVQITSDGYPPYLDAIEFGFGGAVDYARMVKKFHNDNQNEHVVGILKERVSGNPDPKHISTSMIERQNLTIRMCNRRFTRKTNAFSKKLDHHAYAMALHYMHYNFVRIHQTLRVTPAMEAGVTDHLWTLEDVVDLTEWRFEID